MFFLRPKQRKPKPGNMQVREASLTNGRMVVDASKLMPGLSWDIPGVPPPDFSVESDELGS